MADANANKERLTEAQRKQNHIQSERQRREAVRNGFNQLSEIVPGMADQGRSEVKVLTATVEYIAAELEKKKALQEQCMAQGMSEGDFEQIYRNAEKAAEAKIVAGEQRAGSMNGGGGSPSNTTNGLGDDDVRMDGQGSPNDS